MEEPRHSIHLNQVLDILFLIQALLRNLELSVAVQLSSALASTAFHEAAAESFEARYHDKGAITHLKVLFLRNLDP